MIKILKNGKVKYYEYDCKSRERESIAFQINSAFENVTATVGGETGIDIHRTGADKSQILEDFNSNDSYDGIWACASLLHLDTKSLREAFLNVSSLMNKDSIFYCSFKHGEYEGERNGRFFNDQTLESLKELLPSELSISKDWITKDLRADRDESWINLILVK